MSALTFHSRAEFAARLDMPDGAVSSHLSGGGEFIVESRKFRVDLDVPGGRLVSLPADSLWRRFCHMLQNLLDSKRQAELQSDVWESIKVDAKGVESAHSVLGAKWTKVRQKELDAAILEHRKPRLMDLRFASLRNGPLSIQNFSAVNLSCANLCRATLYKVKFDGSCLRKADFDGATLMNVSFRGADLSGASLLHVWLDRDCSFSGAKLDGTCIKLATGQLAGLGDDQALVALVATVETMGHYPLVQASLADQICDGLRDCGLPLRPEAERLLRSHPVFQNHAGAQRLLGQHKPPRPPTPAPQQPAVVRIDVPPNASREQIKRAYRQAALQCHPDKGGTEAAFIALQAERDALIADLDCRERWLA